MTRPVEISASAARVAVIGGGIVGTAAALLAERSGARVSLFEPRAVPGPVATPSAAQLQEWPVRHVAIAPASLQLLAGLGVSPDFPHGAFDCMQVWEELGTAMLTFTAAEVGQPELGRMAEVPGLLAALWERVTQLEGIEVHTGQIVSAVSANADGAWTLHCGEQQHVADLVLAADGARSAIREQLGGTATRQATGHHALATVVRTERAHGEVARQRFLQEGPLALLPSRDPHVVSVVWSQGEQQAERRLALGEQAFCDSLTVASEAVLGRVLAVGQRAAFPITQQLAASFVPAPGVALLGDAGRVVHPLAGLGVNLGLEDVARLRPVLASGKPADWAAWSRQRRARSRLLQDALSGLQRTYADEAPLISLLRNTGVRLLNRSSLARRVLVREALGL